jgi:transposase
VSSKGVVRGRSKLAGFLLEGRTARMDFMTPGLMTDEEWAFVAPFLIEDGPKSGRRPRDHRLVMDGVLWIAHRRLPWRKMHLDFGKWDSVYRQFRRWSASGVWPRMLDAFNAKEAELTAARMVDPTINVRQAPFAGAGGLKVRIWNVYSMVAECGD